MHLGWTLKDDQVSSDGEGERSLPDLWKSKNKGTDEEEKDKK